MEKIKKQKDKDIRRVKSESYLRHAGRKRTEEALRKAYDELEVRVRERTRELARVNEELRVEIEERKRMEEIIRHQAYHDMLTGLPNRRLFIDILGHELAQSRRTRRRLAVLFLDIDRFKYINDTLGHDIGDKLLKEAGDRLKRTIRGSDIVARIGGDEFNILLNDIPHAEDIVSIARKIIGSFESPYLISGHEFHVSTSIGISIYPDDAEGMEDLFKNADIAMYQAKEQGGNTYQFYNPVMNIRTIERMRLESWLRQAIVRGELEVYYQPQFTIDTREVVCAEALVRWRHPEKGMLVPGDFIPLAEETGFITSIDEWVLKRVCTQFREWQEAGLTHINVTVNLSAKQFQKPDLAAWIAHVLERTGFDARRLCIEITEAIAMKNMEYTIPTMARLAGMGVGIVIDDFGTGYSSFNYLKKLPIRKLKIDRSFIKDITTDPDDKAIISAVAAMAHTMKMKVLAEGVETEEQLEYLKSIGCQEIQGNLLCCPVPAQEFEALMASGG